MEAINQADISNRGSRPAKMTTGCRSHLRWDLKRFSTHQEDQSYQHLKERSATRSRAFPAIGEARAAAKSVKAQ